MQEWSGLRGLVPLLRRALDRHESLLRHRVALPGVLRQRFVADVRRRRLVTGVLNELLEDQPNSENADDDEHIEVRHLAWQWAVLDCDSSEKLLAWCGDGPPEPTTSPRYCLQATTFRKATVAYPSINGRLIHNLNTCTMRLQSMESKTSE